MRSYEWTSQEDRQFFTELSKQIPVMVMGSTTYNTFKIKRAPPGRRLLVYTHNPASVTGENVETTAKTPQDLLQQLAREGIDSVLVAGGSAIYGMYLAAGLVDELYITVEPVLLGSGVPFLQSTLGVKLQLLDQRNLNANTVLLHYAISG